MNKFNRPDLLPDEEIIYEAKYNHTFQIIQAVFVISYLIFAFWYFKDGLAGLFFFKTPIIFFILIMSFDYLSFFYRYCILTNKRVIIKKAYHYNLFNLLIKNKYISIPLNEISKLKEINLYSRFIPITGIKLDLKDKKYHSVHISILKNAKSFIIETSKQMELSNNNLASNKLDIFKLPSSYHKKKNLIYIITTLSIIAGLYFSFLFFVSKSPELLVDFINLNVASFVKVFNPKEGAPYHHFSLYYQDKDNFETAIRYAKIAAALEPDKVEYTRHLEYLYTVTRQYELSNNEIRKVIKLDPKNANYYGYLAQRYEEIGLFDKAINILKQEKKLDPKSSSYIELALLYLKINKPVEANEYFTKSVQKESKNYYYILGVCRFYIYKNDVENAHKACKEAIKVLPTDYRGYLWSAEIYQKEKNYNETIKNYNKAILLTRTKYTNNLKSDIHTDLAKLYLEMKQFDKAKQALKTAIKIDKYNSEAVKELEKLK